MASIKVMLNTYANNLRYLPCRPLLAAPSTLLSQKRFQTKHYDPKWRKFRAAKYLKIELPDFRKIRKEASMGPDEIRAKLKKEKMLPPRPFQEREIVIACTNSLFEPYAPPEGDGLASIITPTGANQRVTNLGKKGKSLNQVRKIKKFEEDFDTANFADQAQEIYMEAQNLLQNYKDNEEQLHDLVTEKAYPEMTWKLDRKTVRWKFLESLEPPRTVHVRTTEMMSKENVYAQVTVRLHTQQTLAIYDQFGRLLFGSENLAKDCLEYVVFERHLPDEYSRWRMHGKVIPEWLPKDNSVTKTMKLPQFEPIPDAEENSGDKTESSEINQSDENRPQVATA